MKIYQIWEKIKHESPDVQDLVLATLDPQLIASESTMLYSNYRL